jgi:hypothetical protein
MLKGVKATITFQDTDNHTIHWELIIESGENKAVTDGSITMDVTYFDPSPTLEPVVLEEGEKERKREKKREEDRRREERRDKREEMKREREKREREKREEEDEEVKDNVSTPQEVTKHVCKAIQSVENRYIIILKNSSSKKEKAYYAQNLYEHLTKSLQLIEKNEEWKNTVIQRAYALKEECNDFPNTILSIDTFLKGMKAPIVAPTDEDMKNYIHICIKTVEDSVGTKEKAKSAQILYDYMTNESLDYVKRYENLKKVAIQRANSFKKDCKEFPELIASLDAFLTAVGAPLDEPVVECVKYCTCDKCIEKQTMKEIMKQEDKSYKRWQLMKKLFKKENLVFDDDVMDLYYEWEKTAPRLNRCEKIKAFINANRDTLK